MKKMELFIGLLCFIALLSCGPEKKPADAYKAEVAEELSRLNKLYFEAWQNEDLDSCMSFLAPDFINMFSYGPASNYEQCREANKNVFDNYIIEGVKYERTECFVDCDMAFEDGFFEQQWITNDKSDTIFFKMRGLTVFKKQADGNWKQFRLIAQQ
jgi:ketosteroid isomerase-like protein